MAGKPAEKVGRGRCPVCSEAVMFRKSGGGLLKWDCDGCDTTGFAQPGGAGHARMMATVKVDDPPAPPAPGPAPAPDPAPAPGPAPARRAGFDMGL